jgi:hypothetical protein
MLQAWASKRADTHLALPSAFSFSTGRVKIWAFPALPQSACVAAAQARSAANCLGDDRYGDAMRLIVSNRISTTVCCSVPLLMSSSRCRAIAAQVVTTASAQLQHETDFWSLVACPHKNIQVGVYLQPDPGRLTTRETLWLHELTPLRCINIACTFVCN